MLTGETTTTDHPLVTWVRALHAQRAASSVPAKRLRAQAEQLLLVRHECDPSGEVCRYCGEPFPCLQWRAVAAGWAFLDGFDPEWMPIRSPLATVVDLDDLSDDPTDYFPTKRTA